MRADVLPTSSVPTLTPYSPATGNSGYVRYETGSTELPASGVRVSGTGGQIQLASGLFSEGLVSAQWIADARL